MYIDYLSRPLSLSIYIYIYIYMYYAHVYMCLCIYNPSHMFPRTAGEGNLAPRFASTAQQHKLATTHFDDYDTYPNILHTYADFLKAQSNERMVQWLLEVFASAAAQDHHPQQ